MADRAEDAEIGQLSPPEAAAEPDDLQGHPQPARCLGAPDLARASRPDPGQQAIARHRLGHPAGLLPVAPSPPCTLSWLSPHRDSDSFDVARPPPIMNRGGLASLRRANAIQRRSSGDRRFTIGEFRRVDLRRFPGSIPE